MGADGTINTPGLPEGAEDKLTKKNLSICIVTYNARDWLVGCLDSIQENTQLTSLEIIVVDNGSEDGIEELLERDYPQVVFIGNKSNQGYTRPMNQGLQAAHGEYLMQLNPDTKVLPGGIDKLVSYMEGNPKIGICGPKVLNRDGTFQKQCRRGEPRPVAMISYFLRLSRLFPNSKFFGGYLLEYEDEDATIEVDALSGSCMLIRRQVIEEIGYLDEQFFAYQEDTDFCSRARQAGWKVYYYPGAQIIHYGGQGGSRVEPYRSIIEWHRSYWLYYKKHLAKDYVFIINWLYYAMMLAKLALALLVNFLRRERYAGPKRG
jgi:GT2 family glycosyltransferase